MAQGAQKKLKREFSSGGVVFKRVKKLGVLWLLTKSNPSKLYPKAVWRLPKGWLDDENKGKTPGPLARGDIKADDKQLEKSALREVAEEGGVKAKIIKKIGTEKYFINKKDAKIFKFVTFYLMEWVKDLAQGPSFETSEVAWLAYEEARTKLSYSGEKKILDKAKELYELEIGSA